MPLSGAEFLRSANLLRKAREAQFGEVPEPSPTFLQRVGKVLDFPGMLVRSALVGKYGATEEDILRKFFDAKLRDLRGGAGFAKRLGVGIALDPLTYLGGIGAATKTGKAAQTIAHSRRSIRNIVPQLKAARDLQQARNAALLEKQLAHAMAKRKEALQYVLRNKAPTRLGSTLREQAQLGQRKLASVGVPFGPKLEIMRGSVPLATAAGAVGRGLAAVPGAENLRRLFDPKFGKIREAEEGTAAFEQARRGVLLDIPIKRRQLFEKQMEAFGATKAYNPAIKTYRDFIEAQSRARKATGVPGRTEREISRVAGDRAARMKQIFDEDLAGRLRKPSAKLRSLKEQLEGLRRAGLRESIVGRAFTPSQLREQVSTLSSLKPGESSLLTPSMVRGLQKEGLQFTPSQLKEVSDAIDAGKDAALRMVFTPSQIRAFKEAGARAFRQAGNRELREYPRLLSKIEEQREKVSRIVSGPPRAKALRTLEKIEKEAGERIQTLRAEKLDALRALRAVPVEERERLSKIMDDLDDMFETQKEFGARAANAEKFQELTASYAERILTPEAQAFIANNTKAQSLFNRLINKVTTREGSQIRRQDQFRTLFHDEVNKIFSEKFRDLGFDGDWFELDLAKSLPIRQAQGELSVISAQYIKSLVNQFAKPIEELGKDAIPLSELLAKGPVYKYRDAVLSSKPAIAQKALNEAGLGHLGVPREVAELMQGTVQKFFAPEEVRGFLRTWDGINGIYRLFLTTPFPAFHVRNMLTNVMMNWLGGVSSPRHYLQAFKILRRGADDAEWQKYEQLGLFEGEARETMRMLQGRSAAPGLATREGMTKIPGVGKVVKTASKIQQFVENHARLAHFLAKKDAGLSDFQALESVNKFLFDYGAKGTTEFEKKFGKRLVLFYTWTRKALPRIMQQYVENPAKMAALTRVATDPNAERPPLPEFLRDTAAIPHPFGPGPKGQARFITGTGIPIEELNRLSFLGDRSPLERLGRTVFSMSPPLVKAFVEKTTGKDLFLGKDIVDADRAPALFRHLPDSVKEFLSFREGRSSTGYPVFRANPEILHTLRNLPTSRLISSADKVLDNRKSLMDRILQSTTGVRIQEFDPAMLKNRGMALAVKERIQQLLLEGKAGRFSGYFALGEKGKKDEEVQKLLSTLRELSKQKAELMAKE